MTEVYGAKYRPLVVPVGEPKNIVARVIDFLARNVTEFQNALSIVNKTRLANKLSELKFNDFRRQFILELCYRPKLMQTEQSFKDLAYDLLEKINAKATTGKDYTNTALNKRQEALAITCLHKPLPDCLATSLQAANTEEMSWLASEPIEQNLLPQLRFFERRMLASNKSPIKGVKQQDWDKLTDADKLLIEMELCGINRKAIVAFFHRKDGTLRQRLTILKRNLGLNAESFGAAQERIRTNGLNPYSLLRSRVVDFVFPNRDEITESVISDYRGREKSLGDLQPQAITLAILRFLRTQADHRRRAAHLHLQGMTTAEVTTVINKEFDMEKPASDIARDLRFVRDEVKERFIRSIKQPAPKGVTKLAWSDWIRDKTERRINWLLLYLDGYKSKEIAKIPKIDFDEHSFHQILHDFKTHFQISNNKLFIRHIAARMRRSREDKSYVDRALKLVFPEDIPRKSHGQDRRKFRRDLLLEILRLVPTITNPQYGYQFFKYRAMGLTFNEMSRLTGKNKGTCQANLNVLTRNVRQRYNDFNKGLLPPVGVDKHEWVKLNSRDQSIVNMYLEGEAYEDILSAVTILDANITEISQVYQITNALRRKLGLQPRPKSLGLTART